MRVLVIGGSGYLGSLVLAHMREKHEVRVYDLNAPRVGGIGFVEGNVQDPRALYAAAYGMDALIYMAMGSHDAVDGDDWATVASHIDAFDVSVKGLYLALKTAHEAGVSHAVYTSSMSVYQAMNPLSNEHRYYADENLPADARHIYGFTKRLGEMVCENAAREWRMDINVLRLCLPVPDDTWFGEVVPGEPTIWTSATDTARALLAALEFRAGYQAFTISGDYDEKLMSLNKARRLLGWEPLARPAG